MSNDAPLSDKQISVAIVDDEASVRIGVRRLCQALGLNATTYASGQEFIDSILSGAPRPDCLLLDAHMPQMTGLDLQRQLAGSGVRVPTVVYTADDAPEMQARYMAAGVSAYLRKPIGGDELLAAIERATNPLADR